MSRKIIVVAGTRPEQIKLAPVLEALEAAGADFEFWTTGQHEGVRGQLAQKHEAWEEGLVSGLANTIKWVGEELDMLEVSAVVVQGDTASAFAAAQAAWLSGVPVAHVEAGLRTYASEPFPEEGFRRQIAAVARWHFAPDEAAMWNIAQEIGIAPSGALKCKPEERGVFVVGNTLIDTLPKAAQQLQVLATLHRRENWGQRRTGALEILDHFASTGAIDLYAIHHPNWGVDGARSAFARPPMPHSELVNALDRRAFDLIVTDSGGLQEEAAHFGIPCLVLRTATERTALERADAVRLVHPDNPEALRSALQAEISARSCYGVGDAGRQIVRILLDSLQNPAQNAPKEDLWVPFATEEPWEGLVLEWQRLR